MANTVIQLKRAGSTGAVPTGLANGEMGLDFFTGNLWFKAANGNYKLINPVVKNYGTANVNGTLLVAGTPADILSFIPGTNITLTGYASNNTIKIDASVTGGSGNVTGSGSVSDSTLVRWSGGGGTSVKGSQVSVYDDGSLYATELGAVQSGGAIDVYPSFVGYAYSNVSYSEPQIIWQKYGNTSSSPLAVPVNDSVGSFNWRIYNGTQIEQAASIQVIVSNTNVTGANNHPSADIKFGSRRTTTAQYSVDVNWIFAGDGGIYSIGAAGGSKGVNTINANTLYEQGVSLSTKYGNVSGSGTTTDGTIPIWNGTGGNSIKPSIVTVDGSGNISTSGTITESNVLLGNKYLTVGRGLMVAMGAFTP